MSRLIWMEENRRELRSAWIGLWSTNDAFDVRVIALRPPLPEENFWRLAHRAIGDYVIHHVELPADLTLDEAKAIAATVWGSNHERT